ncbi:MAG TPA: UbiD family decarboxylase, partial [Candidatus Nitrosopelagicus sp.]|nr:UbiD family decarboxylase [Candidatus Nitrosopelagicus sp.]
MTSDLREYISKLKKSKEIKIVKKKVSPKFEIAGITAKADGTSALLFENIKQNNFNLVSNLVGTRKRFALAVNSKENKIHESIYSSIKKAKKPKITSNGKFFENSSKNLSELPIVTHFEKESGPFITSAIVYSQNHEFKTQNSAFHRLMPVDKTHFSIRMVEGRHTHRNFMNAKEHGEDLKVAITVGVHPAISIAGAYQADWGKDELHIANSLLGNKLTLTKCPYTGMHVPSGTEIVMEG